MGKRVKIKYKEVMQAAAIILDRPPNVFDIRSNDVLQLVKRCLAVVVKYEEQQHLLCR